ncbi:MAG: hypothetical protein JWM09_1432 [Francisellaceae bacterium]|nr:hypothetical protein [Francisellaceae bacterium]
MQIFGSNYGNLNQINRFGPKFGILALNRLLTVGGDVSAEEIKAILRIVPNDNLDILLPGYALRFAVATGNLYKVNLLLKVPGVDVTADDNAAIRRAASNGHLAVVERLLQESNVDVTANDNAAIRNAAYRNHLAVVDIICETLRLQIVSDFYAPLRGKDEGSSHKNIKDLKLKFKEAVFTKMGKIDNIKTLIEEKIIQKTFQQYERQKALHECIGMPLPLEILGYISDFDESLNQKPKT